MKRRKEEKKKWKKRNGKEKEKNKRDEEKEIRERNKNRPYIHTTEQSRFQDFFKRILSNHGTQQSPMKLFL